jgi:hypothetical protein
VEPIDGGNILACSANNPHYSASFRMHGKTIGAKGSFCDFLVFQRIFVKIAGKVSVVDMNVRFKYGQNRSINKKVNRD